MGISGTHLEITAEFSGTSSEPFGVSVLSGSGGKTNLVVDQTRDYVLIDGETDATHFNDKEKKSRTQRGDDNYVEQEKRVLRQATDGFSFGY